MKKLKLVVFKDSYTHALRAASRVNLSKYKSETAWAASPIEASKWKLETGLELSRPLSQELLEPQNGDYKDLENAIRLHKLLPDLSRLQARDPRLWTRLTHVDLWNYMRKRWDVGKHMGDPDKAHRYVLAHYFVAQSQSRALLRNGAARLWWTAKLSYDKQRDNPYELTAVLLSTLDITQQLLERSLGRSPVVVKAFLEFLLRNRDPLLQGGDDNRVRIRQLAEFLNTTGGVCLLDCLTESAISRMLDREYARINSSEPSTLAATVVQ